MSGGKKKKEREKKRLFDYRLSSSKYGCLVRDIPAGLSEKHFFRQRIASFDT